MSSRTTGTTEGEALREEAARILDEEMGNEAQAAAREGREVDPIRVRARVRQRLTERVRESIRRLTETAVRTAQAVDLFGKSLEALFRRIEDEIQIAVVDAADGGFEVAVDFRPAAAAIFPAGSDIRRRLEAVVDLLPNADRQTARVRLVALSSMEPRFAAADASTALGRVLRGLAGDILSLYVSTYRLERAESIVQGMQNARDALALVSGG